MSRCDSTSASEHNFLIPRCVAFLLPLSSLIFFSSAALHHRYRPQPFSRRYRAWPNSQVHWKSTIQKKVYHIILASFLMTTRYSWRSLVHPLWRSSARSDRTECLHRLLTSALRSLALIRNAFIQISLDCGAILILIVHNLIESRLNHGWHYL